MRLALFLPFSYHEDFIVCHIFGYLPLVDSLNVISLLNLFIFFLWISKSHVEVSVNITCTCLERSITTLVSPYLVFYCWFSSNYKDKIAYPLCRELPWQTVEYRLWIACPYAFPEFLGHLCSHIHFSSNLYLKVECRFSICSQLIVKLASWSSRGLCLLPFSEWCP